MSASAVKVLLQEDEFIETLWADPVGPHQYRLDNSPFWAYGVSWQDVVEAHPDSDGMLRMTRVVEKSGHRTVRVILKSGVDESSDSQSIMDGVRALGATYEGMKPTYLAIDIPPGVELMTVAKYLTDHGVEWEHADPRYSDLYPDDESTHRTAAG